MRLAEILLFTLGGVWQGIRQDFNLLEVAVIAGLALAWRRGWRPRRMAMPEVRRPWAWAVMLALGFVALRVALVPLLAVPVPLIPDESSHLLLADTLLDGRMANPVHPFWPHFESIHILMRPHYVSVYFPGQAVWLAAGRLVAGSAWAGVLAECAAFLLALYWMLEGWMPARWALFGVLLAGLRFAIGSYWVNAYHGGFLTAIGGALVAGAFARLSKRASVAQGLVLGAGLGILASTRPLEGALYSIPFVAVLAWEFRRNAIALLAAALPVVLCAGALGVYFSHITGSPLVTPYQINQKTYGWPMTLAFVKPPEVEQHNVEFAHYYEMEMTEHQRVDGPVHFLQFLTFRMQEDWRFFLGPALTVPLIMLGRVWRRRRMLLIGAGGGLFAALIETSGSPHYVAPVTAVIVAVVVECCRHLRASRVYVVKLLPVMMVVVLTLRIGAQSLGLPYTSKHNFQSWCCRVEPNHNQARIAAQLAGIPGRHLVFVRTKTDADNELQWIYNDADIDRSRIVWARDLGPERNAALVKYFAGRDVWMVDPNLEPASCVSYSVGSLPAVAAR
ncbi:MAG: hypothetical protein ABSF12_20375 [Bryobacteraceae bacterium]